MWPLEERKQRVEALIAIGLRALVLSTAAHLGRLLLARLGAEAPREVDDGSRAVPPPRLLVVGQRGGHLVGDRVGARSG